jgi:hypothetical protein
MLLCHVLHHQKVQTYVTSKITTSTDVEFEYLEVEYIARRRLLADLAFSTVVPSNGRRVVGIGVLLEYPPAQGPYSEYLPELFLVRYSSTQLLVPYKLSHRTMVFQPVHRHCDMIRHSLILKSGLIAHCGTVISPYLSPILVPIL